MTRSRPQAVVVVVNPMPRLYIVPLVTELRRTHDVTVIGFYRLPIFDQGVVERCAAVGADVHQFEFCGKWDYLTQLARAARLLRSRMKPSGADVFVCQPNHLLTNYPTFAGAARYGNRVHLIPDGLANFYLTSVDVYERAMRFKALIGPFVGLPFQVYKSNYLALGEAAYEDYWYVGSPGLMQQYLPGRQFSPDSIADETNAGENRRILFLGQPPHASPTYYEDYRRVLVAAMRVEGLPMDYKSHPAEHEDATVNEILNDLGVGRVDIGSEAVEIFARRYAAVVGVASSTLFNMRMLGWETNAYSVLDPQLLSRLSGRSVGEMEDVVVAAEALGVRQLPL